MMYLAFDVFYSLIIFLNRMNFSIVCCKTDEC